MLSESSKWELSFVHYFAKFPISRFVISRFECIVMYVVQFCKVPLCVVTFQLARIPSRTAFCTECKTFWTLQKIGSHRRHFDIFWNGVFATRVEWTMNYWNWNFFPVLKEYTSFLKELADRLDVFSTFCKLKIPNTYCGSSNGIDPNSLIY